MDFKEDLVENIPPPKDQGMGELYLTKARSFSMSQHELEYTRENSVLRPYVDSGSYKNVENNVHSRRTGSDNYLTVKEWIDPKKNQPHVRKF